MVELSETFKTIYDYQTFTRSFKNMPFITKNNNFK